MMSRFEFPTEPDSFADLKQRVEELLLNFVADRDQVGNLVKTLVATLEERSTRGDAVIDPRLFLSEFGIDVHALNKWLEHKKRATDQLAERSKQLLGFSTDQNARLTTIPLISPRILVLTGESGQGKSWLLASMAHNLGPEKGIPLLIRATGDFHADRDTIEREVWHNIFSMDGRKDLRRVREHLRQVLRGPSLPVCEQSKDTSTNQELPQPWLVLFIDDVPNKEEVEAICAEGWSLQGIHVVMTTQAAYTVGLHLERGRLEVRQVEDFTDEELSSYLDLHKRPMDAVPEGLRKVLSRPLFAQLFCRADLATANHDASEYTVLNSYWLKLDPYWFRPLRALAGEFLSPGAVYPWGDAALERAGITPELLRTMVSSGWLRHRGNGHFEVWHDRILSWAVAEHIAECWGCGAIDTKAVVQFVLNIQRFPWRGGRNLDFVTMDLVWMLGSRQHLRSRFVDLLAALEPSAHDPAISWIYSKGIATIGMESNQDLLLSCLQRIKAHECSRLPELLAKAWISTGEGFPDVRRLLCAPEVGVWMLGLHIFAFEPQRELMSQVWKLQMQHSRLRGRVSKVIWAALLSGGKKFPDWLSGKVKRTRTFEVSRTVASIIYHSDHCTGEKLWRDCGDVLLGLASHESYWVLGRIISRFDGSDQDLNPVRIWLEKDLDAQRRSDALFPLAVHRPDEVLELLRSNESVRLACLQYSVCLRELAARRPSELQDILILLLDQDPKALSYVADAFKDSPDALTTKMIDSLTKALGRAFEAVDPDTCPSSDFKLFIWVKPILQLLVSVVGPAQISCVRRGLTDQRLEERLAVAITSLPHRHDFEHQEVKQILKRYPGVGLTRLVNWMLSSTSSVQQSWRGGELAYISPDEKTRARLRELVFAPLSMDVHYDDLAGEAHLCSFALLDAGHDLIELILHRGSPSVLMVFDETYSWGVAKSAWSSKCLERTIDQLLSLDATTVISALCASGLCEDKNLIEQVRAAIRLHEDNPEVLSAGLSALRILCCAVDEEVLEWARLGLGGDSMYRYSAQLLLLNSGGPTDGQGHSEALEVLTKSLLVNGLVPLDTRVFPIAVEAWSRCPPDGSQRSDLAKLLWRTAAKNPNWIGDWNQIDDLATDAGVSAIETVGRKLVQYRPSNIRFSTPRVTAGALRALHVTDPDAVWNSLKQHFVNEDLDRGILAAVMLELFTTKDAVNFLVSQAVEREVHLDPSSGLPVIWRIGAAFRSRLASPDVHNEFEAMVRESLNSVAKKIDDPRALYALTILVGTQKSEFCCELLACLTGHYNTTVRRGAHTAIGLHQRQNWIYELIDQIKRESVEDSWLPLNALMDIVTPFAWATRTHPFDFLRDLGLTINCRRQRWHIESQWKDRARDFEKQIKDAKLEF